MKIAWKNFIIIFVFLLLAMLAGRYLVLDNIFGVLFFVFIVFVFSYLVSYLINRQVVKRILNLAFKVQAMAAGDLSRHLHVDKKDEIGQLISTLNDLISRLQTGVAVDVSKHKELAKAKTDFVTIASHQLRTPLSIIKWYIDFLLSGDAGEINDEQKKYLEEVYRSNERLIDLVSALLDVSRIDLGTFSIEPEPMKIDKICEFALKKSSDEIKKKSITINKKYDTLPLINLDPRLTQIVFENIISNSVKYSGKNAIIDIRIKKTKENVYIKISDNGCGIPKEQQPKIFTKLFRADNARKIEASGTGLGLYIVKGIIEKSGGRIWFESPNLDNFIDNENGNVKISIQEAKGSTFHITFPLKGMKKKHGTKKLNNIK